MALPSDKHDLRSTLRACAGQLWSVYGFLLACSILFWYLRLVYWKETHEAPFSDIWGYVVTGDNIARHFFFGFDDAHQTYFTPITPSLIAIAKLIAPVRFERVFRVMVQIIIFVSALGLVREIALVTGRKWLAASFLLIVAICRPSIFWSLKLSTEPVCEAFLYATAATALAALRTRAWYWAVLCGFLALCLGLNRPGFLPGTMLIPLALLIYGLRTRLRHTRSLDHPSAGPSRWTFAKALVPERRAVLMAAVFAIGFFGTWGVWIGRNVINSGAFILTSSSGAQSSIWDYGGGPIKIGRYDSLTLADGSTFTKFGQVMEEANSFAKDYDGAKRLFLIAQAWHKANWMDLPRVFLWRLKHIVSIRGASGLTTVPREYLFVTLTPQYNNPYTPTAWLDLVLLDKTPFICFIALAGLALFAWKYPKPGLVFIGVAFVPWMTSAAVIGYERTVEALIAMTIWFALFGITELAALLNRREAVQQQG